MDKIECMMIKRAVLGTLLAWLIVATAGLIILGLSGCVQGPVGPTAQKEAQAIVLAWDGMLLMKDYPAPVVTWYAAADTRCGQSLEGTAFANGACAGGQISIAGNHRETEINIAWTGSIESSSLCWALVSLSRGVHNGVLVGVEGVDADIDDCRGLLAGL